jgi:hypothetical protein
LPGSVAANATARLTQLCNAGPELAPSASTYTNPFSARPVKVIGLVCGSPRAFPALSVPRRTTSRSPITPQHMCPVTMKVRPPNILRSLTSSRCDSALRTRAASRSSNRVPGFLVRPLVCSRVGLCIDRTAGGDPPHRPRPDRRGPLLLPGARSSSRALPALADGGPHLRERPLLAEAEERSGFHIVGGLPESSDLANPGTLAETALTWAAEIPIFDSAEKNG